MNSLAQSPLDKSPAFMTRWYLKIRYPKMDWLPRKDIFASVMLLITGFGIPGAMCLGLIPSNFLLVFLGLVLLAVGGTLVLIRCGEI